jgi:hypothetical protein
MEMLVDPQANPAAHLLPALLLRQTTLEITNETLATLYQPLYIRLPLQLTMAGFDFLALLNVILTFHFLFISLVVY